MNLEAAAVAPHRLESLGDAREFVNGVSPTMRVLEGVLAELAKTSIPVLLIGESGTGKEMFARRIHALSRQQTGRLSKIQCSAMTSALLLSELGLNENGTRHDTLNHEWYGSI